MNVIAQAVEGSIVTGSIYGLLGVGFALLFRASKVLSFCQGGFMLLGAFLFYDLQEPGGGSFAVSVLVTVVVVAAFSGLVYLVVFARVAAREAFATSVATIGLAGVLQAVFAVRYGTAPLSLPDGVVSGEAFRVFSAVVPVADLIAVGMAAAATASLVVMLRFTPLGQRMNAVADNASLAEHLGISAARVAALAWALAGATAALAGIAFSLRSSVDPVGVANIGLFAFPAIILGGLDSVGGALLGGIILGAVQNTVQVAFGSSWVDLVSFLVMLAILLVRPSGLFGRTEVVRL
ncbi:branched-chain amino acid ABC transporter permease [Actinocorallia populi]|uniref:branched-chain amino acid ABC transporter permease n=1 Tax=Actinocorallia populi TaxID=2079200 RepID=UPI000D088130|nr:branched-chain amino acid ABC transporter permease [Actinocorallia populi]